MIWRSFTLLIYTLRHFNDCLAIDFDVFLFSSVFLVRLLFFVGLISAFVLV